MSVFCFFLTHTLNLLLFTLLAMLTVCFFFEEILYFKYQNFIYSPEVVPINMGQNRSFTYVFLFCAVAKCLAEVKHE